MCRIISDSQIPTDFEKTIFVLFFPISFVVYAIHVNLIFVPNTISRARTHIFSILSIHISFCSVHIIPSVSDVVAKLVKSQLLTFYTRYKHGTHHTQNTRYRTFACSGYTTCIGIGDMLDNVYFGVCGMLYGTL